MGQPACQGKAIKNGVLWPRLTRIPIGTGFPGPCVKFCEVVGPSHSPPGSFHRLWFVLLAWRFPPPCCQFLLSTCKLFSQTCCCFPRFWTACPRCCWEGWQSGWGELKLCWALLAGMSWESSATSFFGLWAPGRNPPLFYSHSLRYCCKLLLSSFSCTMDQLQYGLKQGTFETF